MSGWMDIPLIESGRWNKTFPLVHFDSAMVYFKFEDYYNGDEIVYSTDSGTLGEGFGWHEMFENASPSADEMITRDALSVIAAFISHCDNFDGNQGFICLDKEDANRSDLESSLKISKSKSTCDGTPFLYIHDVGGTLGYGWSIKHVDLWPNYMDLKQVC